MAVMRCAGIVNGERCHSDGRIFREMFGTPYVGPKKPQVLTWCYDCWQIFKSDEWQKVIKGEGR